MYLAQLYDWLWYESTSLAGLVQNVYVSPKLVGISCQLQENIGWTYDERGVMGQQNNYGPLIGVRSTVHNLLAVSSDIGL